MFFNIQNLTKICYGLLFVMTTAYAESALIATDPLKAIIVDQSEPTFTIILQSNPTTGYSWTLKNYDANLILPIEHKFHPPHHQSNVGVPGYEKWIFKVKLNGFISQHSTRITLIYKRPWEKESAKTINFTVTTHTTNDMSLEQN